MKSVLLITGMTCTLMIEQKIQLLLLWQKELWHGSQQSIYKGYINEM